MGTVNEPLVRLDSVELSYDGAPVLAGVDLTLRAGDFVGVVGPSGAGKTTLLRLALGTLRPTTGRVERARGLRVGYVPQLETVSWSFPVTVAECVLMVRSDRWLPWATRAERRAVTEVLDRLGIAHLADRHIRELSGGQQQRMFLARALLRDPQLLLLDEPTSGIDVATRHEMLHLLGHLHDDGMTILLTTHDLNGVAAHVPDLVAMNGTVLRRGAPADVMTPTVLETHYRAVADAAEIPVLLYHVPKFSPIVFQADMVRRLSGHPGIIGMKDTSQDMVFLTRCLADCPDDFTIYVGTANILLAGLALGAAGGVLALANIAPEECVTLCDLFEAGRVAEARALQQKLLPVNQAITVHYGISGLKHAHDLLGMSGGETRRPLLPLASEDREALKHILKEGLGRP